jgi:signal transduction histidine kinase
MNAPPLGPEGVLPLISAVCLTLLAAYALVAWRRFGTPSLLWFSGGAFVGALFGASSMSMGLGVSAHTEELCSRVSMCAGGLHGAFWIRFLASQEGGPPTRLDRGFAWLCVIAATLALVPGLVVSSEVFARTAWFGLVYRDSVPTAFGTGLTGLYALGLLYIAWRTARLWRRDVPGAGSQLVASALLTATAANDSLAFSGVTRMPYLNDLGLLALGLGVGASFVDVHARSLRALGSVRHDLEVARDALVRRERLAALGELSAVVAHEVRNPVAVLFNAVPMLRRTVPPDAVQAHALVDIVGEEAARIRRIVDDLLDFVRPLELRRDAIGVPALLETVLAAQEESARASISVENAAGAAVLNADAHLVRLAVANLVRNAVQSGTSSAGVHVRCHAEDERVTITIIDHGEGVAESDLPRLFTPFFTTRPTGTGLGLAFVKRVAEAHGGSVAYAPTPGGGATFALTLPRG